MSFHGCDLTYYDKLVVPPVGGVFYIFYFKACKCKSLRQLFRRQISGLRILLTMRVGLALFISPRCVRDRATARVAPTCCNLDSFEESSVVCEEVADIVDTVLL